MKKLNDMKSGDSGKVSSVSVGGKIRQRLMDMGLVKGSEIEVIRVAPLGDPIEIRIKGYNLSLRKEEASAITMEVS